MNRVVAEPDTSLVWPRWWRMLLLALSTVILCACRSTNEYGAPGASIVPAAHAQPPMAAEMPPQTCAAPGCGSWRPPGIAGPWPEDEYLRDGGDFSLPASVDQQWRIYGLEQEDTIAHFDTLDGRRLVEPACPVCIYAPRFAAVRSITGPDANDHVAMAQAVDSPEGLILRDEIQEATTSIQPIAPVRQVTTELPSTYQTDVQDGIVAQTLKAVAIQDALLPYENLSLVRMGLIDQAEGPRLAKSYEAALTWTHDQAVQIILDRQAATEDKSYESVGRVYVVDETPGPPKLRVCKLASTKAACPGEFVDFTIRYDNVGQSTVGNVTIVDNLANRLAYVPGTAQCSQDANFIVEPNQGVSAALRWEIIPPLEPGDGGIIRFRCRVR